MFLVEFKAKDGEWKNAVAHNFYAAKGFYTEDAAKDKKKLLKEQNPKNVYRVREEE